ncbi:MAG: hypothetical protein NZT92_13230 [Abditibacteriales bacterium]|nr:hypothetical protein [Abditibacteriales bacterium]
MGWATPRVDGSRPGWAPPVQPDDPSWLTTLHPLTGVQAARHVGGINALFCDGHVKWLRPEAAYERRRRSRDGELVAWRYTIHLD